MKLFGFNNEKFTIHIDGPPITPSDACPAHASLDDLKAARQAQQVAYQKAAKRMFGDTVPATDVVAKIEPKRNDGTVLTDKLAADGDLRRTRKRSPKPKPKTNGAGS